jgi:Uma2 family endonuclease
MNLGDYVRNHARGTEMSVVTHDPLPGRQPPFRAAATEQRLLLHNVSWQQYQAIGEALKDRPGLRLTYDRGNLEIMTTSCPPAPAVWTSDTQRILLHLIDWQQYETLLRALDEHHLRLTYDRGNLEIMTLSPEHERFKHLLRRLFEVLSEELGIFFEGLGSTTYRREDLVRGLEPDECYYLNNWPRVRDKKRIDLSSDPPPDLAIEIDITHSSLSRMSIYASLGVPEIWRFDGENLRIARLVGEGKYEEKGHSSYLPAWSLTELVPFVRKGLTEGEVPMVRAFRVWVREQVTKG